MLLCAHLCNTQGLTSKNAKQRTECLLEMGAMIERDGLTVAGLVYSPFELSFSLSLSLSLSVCLFVLISHLSTHIYLTYAAGRLHRSFYCLVTLASTDLCQFLPTNVFCAGVVHVLIDRSL